MNDNFFDINEIFFSIDGEGVRTGQLAVFVRLNGCNMKCSYCDTTYSLKPSDNKTSLTDLVNKIKAYKCKNITITGGEPLLHHNLPKLIEAMKDYSFNIETNGSMPIDNYLYNNTVITMDLKTPSSKQVYMNDYRNLDLLRKQDVLKFVVSSDEDIDFAFKLIDSFKPEQQIYLSPIFKETTGDNIVERMKLYGNENIKLQLQMHKYIWDSEKRGV